MVVVLLAAQRNASASPCQRRHHRWTNRCPGRAL